MKKKLEEAYMPDKDSRRRRVLVGLSGGIHSMVTAYLLKIQKYDIVAVTVALDIEGTESPSLFCRTDSTKIQRIKDFCQMLGIAHQVISGSDEFKEGVLDGWLAKKISGTYASPCWSCHELRMRLLSAKAKELQIPNLATGHFAKLFRHETNKTVYVHTGNEDMGDQSAMLARLPHSILDMLLLPLSDLSEKEVLKLAENFGIENIHSTTKMHQCLTDGVASLAYLEANVPNRFNVKGEVVTQDGEKLHEHEGVYRHHLGEVMQESDHAHSKAYFVSYSMAEKRIITGGPESFAKTKLILLDCHISEETPWIEPLRCVLKTSAESYVDCWAHPKNLSSAYVELDQPVTVLEGDMVTLQRKKGKNSKVYLSGIVRYLKETLTDEGSESAKNKIDFGRDF